MYFSRTRFLLLYIVLFGIDPALRAVEPIPDFPPEPVQAEVKSDDEEAKRKAWLEWAQKHEEWEENLTVSQFQRFHEAKWPEEKEPNGATKRYLEMTQLPTDSSHYSWRTAADGRNLTPEVKASLEAHKIVFGPSVLQSFSPYIEGPVFITSDSILNTYHVLLEDSFRELELRQAANFHLFFEALLKAAHELPQKEQVMVPERVARAWTHLQLAIGPAMYLCGTSLDYFDEPLREPIKQQAALISKAEGTGLPAFLAPAESSSLLAIDYSRCKVVGFYAGHPRLTPYFQAMRWLQIVPFRGSREQEYDAFLLLSLAAKDSAKDEGLNPLRNFLGHGDELSPDDLTGVIDHTFPRSGNNFDIRIARVRTQVVSSLLNRGLFLVNSDLRARARMVDAFDQLDFRVVSSVALKESVLFQQLLNQRLDPSGPAFAMYLGSDYAKKSLSPAQREAVAVFAGPPAAEVRWKHLPKFDLYEQYLKTLRSVFLPAAPEAPDFMRSELWAAKSCQTALASWAQFRHTFTLQAKRDQAIFGLSLVPPGFVEPNPEFFARFTTLVRETRRRLYDSGAFAPSATLEADRLAGLVEYLRRQNMATELCTAATLDALEGSLRAIDAAGRHYVEAWEEVYGSYNYAWWKKGGAVLPQTDISAKHQALLAALEVKVAALRKGQVDLSSSRVDLGERWEKLEALGAKLEAMAHKELRRLPWTTEEDFFLKSYGEACANLVGYCGNSWMAPNDDAPRWAEVSGLSGRPSFLAAGVGRPREIYVLYPWNGMEILCVGSVMQYYEYETSKRLTDPEWREALDGAEAPPIPAWLAPYATKPVLRTERH